MMSGTATAPLCVALITRVEPLAVNALVVQVAGRVISPPPVGAAAPQPAIGVPPSVKLTVLNPEAVDVTVAVKVTLCPKVDEVAGLAVRAITAACVTPLNPSDAVSITSGISHRPLHPTCWKLPPKDFLTLPIIAYPPADITKVAFVKIPETP